MKIAITGASGLIGSAVVPHLEARGHTVLRFVRRPPVDPTRETYWNPDTLELDGASLAGIDAVVHLAGENIGGGLWTKTRKERIRRSRTDGTSLLARAVAAAEPRPRLFLSTSATGYYGDTGAETISEQAPTGGTFLAEVCRGWEEATAPAADAGVRVVICRLGVVLSKAGGMLGKTLPLFKLGLGGKLGNGRQYMAWVTREDVARAMEFLISNEQTRGAFNVVSPNAVTNAEFTSALGRALRRPAFLTAPAPILRFVMGQMAEEMLLASCRAIPARLTESGFVFKDIDLHAALKTILARKV